MIERYWNADLIAKVLGVVFLIVGLVGFVPNPIIWETGYFEVNTAHNFVHIITGVILLAGAFMNAPVMIIRGVAILYTLVAIVGFAMPDTMWFGVLMNHADHWLHAALALVLLLLGFLTPIREPLTHVDVTR
jgi:uncharacterized membrane protein